MTSDIFALSLLVVVVGLFLWHAIKSRSESLTIEDHMLAGRTTNKKMFGASFVVTSTSLATVLLFFLFQSELYGLFLLFAGLTFFLGQFIFLKRINVSNLETRDMTSNADFWLKFSGGTKSASAISIISFVSFIVIFFVELYVGSVILNRYFVFAGEYASLFAFGILGLLTIGYVQIGGFKTIIKTDYWQAMLVGLAVFSILIFALITPSSVGPNYLTNVFNYTATTSEVISLLFLLLFLNLAVPFSQVTFWQRVASSPDKKEAFEGFKQYLPLFFVIWLVPVVAFVLLNAKGITFPDVESFFDLIQSGSILSEFVLFPIIFVGLAAALFSTADSALIAIQFSLVDKTMFREKFERLSHKAAKKALVVASLAIVLALFGIFYLAESSLSAWFVPLIFAIFGVLVVVSPLIIYGLLKSQKGNGIQLTKFSDSFLALGLYLAGISILVVTTISVQINSTLLSQFAAFVGIAVSLTFFVFTLLLNRNNISEQ